MVQVEKAMGKIKDQQKQLATKANIKKTWQDLLAKANIHGEQRDKPLELKDLRNALHPATMLIVFIY